MKNKTNMELLSVKTKSKTGNSGSKNLIKDFFFNLQTQLGILGYVTQDDLGCIWLEFLPQKEAVDFICKKILDDISNFQESISTDLSHQLQEFLIDIEIRLLSIRSMSNKNNDFNYKEYLIAPFEVAVNWFCGKLVTDVEEFKTNILNLKKSA